eukprot:291656-Alexandrium_andersonii.AAC.1
MERLAVARDFYGSAIASGLGVPIRALVEERDCWQRGLRGRPAFHGEIGMLRWRGCWVGGGSGRSG